MIVIRCIGKPGISFHPSVGSPAGLFLKSYDPEAHHGRGLADWTNKLDEAMKFKTTGEAWMLWRSQSKVQPLRADGVANRPLTAFSIELCGEEDAGG